MVIFFMYFQEGELSILLQHALFIFLFDIFFLIFSLQLLFEYICEQCPEISSGCTLAWNILSVVFGGHSVDTFSVGHVS